MKITRVPCVVCGCQPHFELKRNGCKPVAWRLACHRRCKNVGTWAKGQRKAAKRWVVDQVARQLEGL